MKSSLPPFGFLALALLAACFGSGTANGQDFRASSWDNLHSLVPGQEIRVVMNDWKTYQGEFESLSDDEITLRQKKLEQTLARIDVLRVSQKIGREHVQRNMLIGMAVGAGSGLAIGAIANHVIWSHVNCDLGPAIAGCGSPPNPHWVIILTPVGGLAGSIIGVHIRDHAWRDLYRARG